MVLGSKTCIFLAKWVRSVVTFAIGLPFLRESQGWPELSILPNTGIYTRPIHSRFSFSLILFPEGATRIARGPMTPSFVTTNISRPGWGASGVGVLYRRSCAPPGRNTWRAFILGVTDPELPASAPPAQKLCDFEQKTGIELVNLKRRFD